MAWQLPDDEMGLRRWVLYIISLTMALGGLLFGLIETVLWLQQAGPLLDVAGGVGIALCGGLVYWLARQGRLRVAGVSMIALLTLVPTFFLFVEGPKLSGILFFAVGVVFADLVLGGRAGLVVAALNSLVYIGISLAYELGLLTPVAAPSFIADVAAVALMLMGLTLASGLFTRGMRQALRQAESHEDALCAVDQEKARLLVELQAHEEAQRRLLETVRELASPVIPLAPGVIAMPLIGELDSWRAQQMMDALLRGVSEHRASVVIVDITGVTLVDTAVAAALLRAAQGVRLLGAEVILTGMRSEVAQTVVGLGMDLGNVVTRSTLQEGLAHALRSEGRL